MKFILREFQRQKRFTLLFTVNLTIGLLGFIILDALKRDFSALLLDASKTMLTADLEIAGRRDLTEDEHKTVQRLMIADAKRVRIKTLYSMIQGPDHSSLAEVKGIDPGHPHYGEITLKNSGIYRGEASGAIFQGHKIWIAPELGLQLGVKPGDQLGLGELKFEVADLITDDTGMKWTGASLAPRVYISFDSLMATKLIRKGSIVWHSYLYKVSDKIDIEELETTLSKGLEDPGIRVTSHIESGENGGRMLKYLGDYLGLVALVALALAGLGASYLFRSYLAQKRKDIAILLALGFSHNKAISLYLFKLALLGFLATMMATALAAIMLPLSGEIVKALTPLEFQPVLSWQTALIAAIMGIGGAVFMCLPGVLQIRLMHPADLLRDSQAQYKPFSIPSLLAMIPVIGAFYALSVWQSHSWFIGSIFCGLMLASVVILGGLGLGLIQLSKKIPTQALTKKLAFRYVQRKKAQAMMGFLAISLGSVLINLIPLIKSNLDEEIAAPAGQALPSLFMFDIQEEQIDDIRKLVQQETGLTISASPMIRARLTQINGMAFKKDETDTTIRERQQSQRMRNRGINLSYRTKLDSSERIVEGRQFSETFNDQDGGVAEITLEIRYSKRIGVQINDVLTFEIQGIPIRGKVVGLRKIKWTTFQPNFFIQFQPNVLDDAPKTFIASVPSLESDAKMALQTNIVRHHPNISIIDVTKLMDKILSMVDQMAWILLLMAILSTIAGFIVLFSIANYQAETRLRDINLLKILGLTFSDIRRSIIVEFLLISFPAVVLGASLSAFASYTLSTLIFEHYVASGLWIPVAASLGTIAISITLALIATQKVLKKHPRLYLN